MENKPDFSIRRLIIKSRHSKEESREKKVILKGSSDENLVEIEGDAELVLKELMEENSEWIEIQKKRILADFSSLNEEKVVKVYNQGLLIFLKQQYRLFTNDQKSGQRIFPSIMKSRDYLRQQIIAYTFDFIQSLKASKKEGLTPDQALKLAYLSYRHDPDVLKKLSAKYPKIEKWILKQILLQHPSDSEQFIIDYLKTVDELIIKYPEVDLGVIHQATLGYFDPVTFIENYLKEVERLLGIYPKVHKSVLKYAALYFSDPEKEQQFILKHLKV